MSNRKVLIPLNLHNTFMECDEALVPQTSNFPHRVHPFLVPLITQLTNKRPTWQFVDKSNRAGSEYSRFTIMVGDEKIGTVWRETNWRSSEPKFAFDNTRLSKARQRGSWTETKDLRKAVKTILENMYPTIPSEFVAAARSEASTKLQTKLYEFHRDYRSTKDALAPIMERFTLDNPDALKRYQPQVSDKVDTLLVQHTCVQMARTIQVSHEDQKTTLLIERGDKVYVEHTSTPGQFTAYRMDELPGQYKQALGVLKLSPVETLVPDLGFRVADNIYIVCPKEEAA